MVFGQKSGNLLSKNGKLKSSDLGVFPISDVHCSLNNIVAVVSGEISTSELLDREEKSEYELLVEAVDRGQPPKSSQTVVRVVIEDVNDQTPGKINPLNNSQYITVQKLDIQNPEMLKI